ncbi:MAG: nucleoside 2-deoxyribosyltransferase [Acidobacteriota bacterium]|nr:nucleoside 2-deoxyribosyltransferase [Acidobacteriota bacterium]
MADTKTTAPKPFCFVLMPFSEEFDDVYRLGIKEACDKAGAYCERVDEQIFSERILDRVYNQIAKADLIVADMSGRNPNVFYEVGYAHALGKLTILLTKNADDIPFDLKHFTHIVYGTKISILRDELEKRVKYFIENPPTKSSEIKLGLELFLGQENLALEKGKYAFNRNIPLVITIFNSSTETFNSGDFKIGIITHKFSHCSNYRSMSVSKVTTTSLPSGAYLHMMPDFPTLFPNAYTSFQAYFISYGKETAINERKILVRLFTKQGSRDFPVTIENE